MQDVLLTVPTRGQIGWATVTRLDQVRDRHPGLPPVYYQPGNLSVAQTRNKIVNTFLAGDWQILAMVDDDVVPAPHFLEMRRFLTDDIGLVALPHPMPVPPRYEALALTVFQQTPEGLALQPIEQGFHYCAAVATGCVLIRRDVFEEAGLRFRIDDDPEAAITSDDFLFCADLQEAGYKLGYFYDGWFADHHHVCQLAPLYEERVLA